MNGIRGEDVGGGMKQDPQMQNFQKILNKSEKKNPNRIHWYLIFQPQGSRYNVKSTKPNPTFCNYSSPMTMT